MSLPAPERKPQTRMFSSSGKERNNLIRQSQHGEASQHRRPYGFFSIFQPQLHGVPSFKYVSSFMPSFTGPCCAPPSTMLLMVKNIWSRSTALINFARAT